MEISVLGRNLKVTPQLEDYTLKKVNRLDRFLPNIAEIRVEYERQHTRRGENLSVAQITVRHKRGAILRSQETVPGEMEHALNQAIDKMYRQIQRFKGKRSRKGRERFSATLEELNVAEEIPGEMIPAEEAEEAAEPEITRRKTIIVEAMTETEAIEQMELLGHTFFVYLDQNVGGIVVLYKRKMGDYGLLIPKLG
ncbi:MAG: ribosome hibernation-promoting factor, HPF/YfiA family [Candidatus Flexifilum sp.]|jgi:putative sigma-54 modulation protein|nr:MAG: ribosomal subunit interface protein [Phototrophicales bacterium]